MKPNKKRFVLILAVLTMAIVLSFVFVACDKKKDEPAPPQNTSPSEGLEYSFDKYGSHYGYVVTDIGSCTDNNVIIPSEYKSRTVKSIGDNAFKDCIGITSITIPDSVTSIGYSAFSGCKGLTKITIPDSVTRIGESAFNDTTWYNNQHDGLVYAGKVAYKYKGTMPANTSIVLKEGTLGIVSTAFSDCNELTSVTIPDSVTSIGSGAFSNCTNLTSITIGNSVTSIGYSAFSGCSGLTSITFNGTIAQWYAVSKGTNWKYGMPGACKVVCTDGTISIGNAG